MGSMDLIQAAIIYIACGAPFGVHHLMSNGRSGPSSRLKALLLTLGWVAYLPAICHRFVKARLSDRNFSTQGKPVGITPQAVRECSRAIEAFAGRNGTGPGIYEIRNAVERFAGISELLENETDDESRRFEGFSKISDHPEPLLAEAVLARRNRAALEDHRSRALEELIEIHGELSHRAGRDSDLDQAFARLTGLYGDREIAGRISREDFFRHRESLNKVTRPRVLGDRWRSSKDPQLNQGLSLSINEISMTSRLQNED